MDLNDSIGNVDGEADLTLTVTNQTEHWNSLVGYLSWAGRYFGRSAEDIRVHLEGVPDDRPMLHAKVITEDGEKRDSVLDLGEEIGNHNGQLYRRNWTF